MPGACLGRAAILAAAANPVRRTCLNRMQIALRRKARARPTRDGDQVAVAAALLAAVEPGILPGGTGVQTPRSWNFGRRFGRQDARPTAGRMPAATANSRMRGPAMLDPATPLI